MRQKSLLIAILTGSIASIILNAAVILWNSDGSHNRAAERFFTLGSLMFPGFESGILAVAANAAVLAVLLVLLVWFFQKVSKRTEE
jgi:ABC-type multidrug transport system permease subunit